MSLWWKLKAKRNKIQTNQVPVTKLEKGEGWVASRSGEAWGQEGEEKLSSIWNATWISAPEKADVSMLSLGSVRKLLSSDQISHPLGSPIIWSARQKKGGVGGCSGENPIVPHTLIMEIWLIYSGATMNWGFVCGGSSFSPGLAAKSFQLFLSWLVLFTYTPAAPQTWTILLPHEIQHIISIISQN